MEFKEMKDFLDYHSENYKTLNDSLKFNDDVRVCETSPDGIHVYEGIDIIVRMMNLELNEIKTDDDPYPYTYFFLYNGVRFFQIEEERLEGYGCD